MRIAINGLGRIGRLVLRALYNEDNIEIVALNSPANIETIAHLIKYDSSHGIFNEKITFSHNHICIGNKTIPVYSFKNIEDIPWKKHAVDYVVESSGKFNNRKDATKHIASGTKKVLITAPCIDADNTIVVGVNHHTYRKSQNIISLASCTTNALAPIAKILHEKYSILSGYVTTIHAYTADQKLLDSSHKDLRRARNAASSMIPTKTGATKTIGQIIPDLEGKLSGSAIRVPTSNVSLIDLSVCVNSHTNIGEIHNNIEEAINNGMESILKISYDPLVSIDFNHTTHSSIIDANETNVLKENFIRILSWYDNEWAFSCRVVDLLKILDKYGI